MDDSWRMKMGMPFTTTTTKTTLPRQRENSGRRRISGEEIEFDPEDFNDVFGGPPQSVLKRQFSGDVFTRSIDMLYEDVFLPPGARILPEFRIPVEKVDRRNSRGFYGDIFGCDEDEEMMRRSRTTRSVSLSKGSSSSALSSEDVSPLRPVIAGDCYNDVSFLASNLRPINVPTRRNSTTKMHEEYQGLQGMPALSCHPPSYNSRIDHNNDFRSPNLLFNRKNSSPESMSLDPNSYSSHKVSTDAFEFNSPSSVVFSSLCKDCDDDDDSKACKGQDYDDKPQLEMLDLDEDEVICSYVIEISPDYRHGTREEEIAVDEAIAWAKEKFQGHCSENNLRTEEDKHNSGEIEEVSTLHQFPEEQRDRHDLTEATMDQEPDKWTTGEEKQQLQNNTEMESLDEMVRLWSTGKEADIQLLLSSLHHIAWPESGWLPIALKNLIDNAHVKKAYQKARLCLHPDKLQQRGATIPQKYVAHKAFTILQDAWAEFLSQDVFLVTKEQV